MFTECYNDARFVDIGDLPSGFHYYQEKELYVRPFSLAELSLIHRGRSTDNLRHILRAVDMVISMPVQCLLDGDLEFIMAWLRLNSYPDSPLMVNWLCSKRNLVYSKDKSFYTGPSLSSFQQKLQGIEQEICDTENNELVHSVQTTIHHLDDDFNGLPPYADIELEHPVVWSLIPYLEYVERHPDQKELADLARWIKQDSFGSRLEVLLSQPDMGLYSHIKRIRLKYRLGISETFDLKCRTCSHTLQHTAPMDKLTYFADNSDQAILNIKYRLMSVFGALPTNDMASKDLLYFNSCYLKDKQELMTQQNINKYR